MKRVILLMSCAALAIAEVPGVIAIRNAKVVTASGPTLAKATVVVRNGLIEAVGAEVAVPADAWVIEGEQLTVYPGLIDALSGWGLQSAPATPAGGGVRGGGGGIRGATPATPATQPATPPARGPEDRPSNTSWVHAQDLVQISDRNIAAARNAGFTTAVTYPTTGIFAGQGAAINLGGERTGEMVVAAPTGLYVSLSAGGPRGGGGGGGFPGSLMGVIAYIRQIYIDADYYKAAKEGYEKNPRGQRRPQYDRALEGVLEAPRVLLPADRAVEIARMISFAAELKRSAILYGGHEAHRSTELLKRTATPVLVNLRWPERDRDADPELQESLRTLEFRENAPGVPAALAKAGVKFAFYSGAVERPADIRRAVKRAVDAGLPSEAAVRALTLGAAEIYGIADRLGSIERGKIANLVVADGDLFADATRIKHVLVDGVKYEPTAEAAPEGSGERGQ